MTYTENHTLNSFAQELELAGASKIQINFKTNKVTASCRVNGFSYGSRGLDLRDALQKLKQNVLNFKP